MNKKGFTLIELLAVLLILGIIGVIVVPTILSSFNNVKGSLSEQEIKSISEAMKLIAVDLNDKNSSIYNCKESSWISTKCEFDENGKWKSFSLTWNDLVDKKYLEDNSHHCSGNVTLNNDQLYTVDVSRITCN